MHLHELGWSGHKKEARAEAIRAVEDEIGISFPADYLECVIRFHGGKPARRGFKYNHPRMDSVGSSLTLLLSFRAGDMENVIQTYRRLSRRFPNPFLDGLVPFGTDGGGDCICFDFRDKSTPQVLVVYWSHEEEPPLDVIPLANSFSDFLAMLQ